MRTRIPYQSITIFLAFFLIAIPVSCQSNNVNLQLGILVDSSGSIGQANFDNMKEALAKSIESPDFPKDGTVQLTIVQFSNDAQAIVSNQVITDSSASQAVRNMQYLNGGTAINLGFDKLRDIMSQNTNPSLKRHINIITDGSPNSQSDAIASRNSLITTLQMQANKDRITAEGIGDAVTTQSFQNNMLQLVWPESGVLLDPIQGSVQYPTDKGWVLLIRDWSNIEQAIKQKIQAIIHDDIKLQLGILVDSSGSIGQANFDNMKEALAKSIESSLFPKDGRIQLTIVQFSTGVNVIVDNLVVNDASSAQAVRSMQYDAGWTNTNLGLDKLKDIMSKNLKPSAIRHIDLITDGEPINENGDLQQATILSRNNLLSTLQMQANKDRITAEGIGNAVTTTSFQNKMLQLVWPETGVLLNPGLLPMQFPSNKGWVLLILDWSNIQQAIKQKIIWSSYTGPCGFEDNFNQLNSTTWIQFGTPVSQVLASVEARNGVFDNNGDSWCDSGVVSKDTVSFPYGFAMSSDIFLKVTNPQGCWADDWFGLTTPNTPSGSGVCPTEDYSKGIYFGIEYAGDSCSGTPVDKRRHAYIKGAFLNENGNWESIGDYRNGDAYINGWHKFAISVGANRQVKFYVDNIQVYSSITKISSDVLKDKKVIIGGRSSGSAGKAYNDYIKIACIGLPIALQASNGQYLCAEGSGGGAVVANRNAISAWETFGLIDLGNKYIALRADNGQYVCAEGSGGGAVVANRNAIGAWETLGLLEVGDDNKVALRAANGQFFCAERGGGDGVVANRNAVLAWETFRKIDLSGNTKWALKAANGQYVCAEGSGGGAVVANRNAVGAWETFGLIDLGNSNIALRAANGQYVCAEGSGGGAVVANRNSIGAWETFKLIDKGNGNLALRAANGQYACAEGSGGGAVVANRNAIGAWETFKLVQI